MITNTKRWIETHTAHLFFGALVLGIITPGFERVPAILPAWILSGVIFFACSNITLASIKSIKPYDAAIFYIARFLVLPLVIYYIAAWLIPSFSTSMILLTALPAGSSAPALTLIAGGNTALSLGVTVISGILSPLTVPALMSVTGAGGIKLDTFGMLISMTEIIFVPMGLYFLVANRIKPAREWSQKNAKWLSTLLTAIVVFMVIAMKRNEFLEDTSMIFITLLVEFAAFTTLFLFGLLITKGKDHPIKVSMIISSVIMNNALGISIALLYFPASVSIFMVLTEIPWVLSVSFLQRFLKEKSP